MSYIVSGHTVHIYTLNIHIDLFYCDLKNSFYRYIAVDTLTLLSNTA